MILSQRQLEEIAASTTKDFNRFFFGDEADKPDRSALPTPIDQFAKNYLGLRVSFARLSPDGSICGVTAYDEQYVDLSRRLDEAVQRKVKFAEAMSEDNKWLTLMKSVSGATMLSHDLVDESVELVKVHEDGSIELVMKYGDIYALTVQSIKEVQEAM